MEEDEGEPCKKKKKRNQHYSNICTCNMHVISSLQRIYKVVLENREHRTRNGPHAHVLHALLQSNVLKVTTERHAIYKHKCFSSTLTKFVGTRLELGEGVALLEVGEDREGELAFGALHLALIFKELHLTSPYNSA